MIIIPQARGNLYGGTRAWGGGDGGGHGEGGIEFLRNFQDQTEKLKIAHVCKQQYIKQYLWRRRTNLILRSNERLAYTIIEMRYKLCKAFIF